MKNNNKPTNLFKRNQKKIIAISSILGTATVTLGTVFTLTLCSNDVDSTHYLPDGSN
jgi:hypothetical protein